ncbi:hypothetical protein J6590_079235 [Homalodisca vitripennis]|nr:hypothetical protein J6590_079235 [Homalodisca vitripennis]
MSGYNQLKEERSVRSHYGFTSGQSAYLPAESTLGRAKAKAMYRCNIGNPMDVQKLTVNIEILWYKGNSIGII